MALRVAEGYQLKHNGKVLHSGDSVEGARPAEVQKWLSAGWVEEVKESSKESSAKKQTTKGGS